MGNILEEKEGCFGDVFHALVEGEGLVEDDDKILDVRGGR